LDRDRSAGLVLSITRCLILMVACESQFAYSMCLLTLMKFMNAGIARTRALCSIWC